MKETILDSLLGFWKLIFDLYRKNKYTNASDEKELLFSALTSKAYPVYTTGNVISEGNVNITGIDCTYQVLFNPYLLLLSNLQSAAVITDTVSEIHIYVDDSYMRMSATTQEFILWHEIGHIALDHPAQTTKERLRDIPNGVVSAIELAADMHSVAKVGADNAISALTELSNIIKGKAARKELVMRRESIASPSLKGRDNH